MIINKNIKQAFKDIGHESIKYANIRCNDVRYFKRLLYTFKNTLSEDEQLFILAFLLHNMHFKNMLVDDEYLFKINNIKLRSILFIFTLLIILIFIISELFTNNTSIDTFFKSVIDIIKIIGI